MKIIAILEVSITAGGGFNQSLNAVLQMKTLLDGKYDFSVVSTNKENVNYLKHLKIDAEFFQITFLDKLLPRLFSNRICSTILSKIKLICPFEKWLISKNCDLVYFVEQSSRAESLQILNFITTVWDLCHLDQLEFPEVREFGEFKSREWVSNNTLRFASIILTDSDDLAEKISFRYGVDKERIVAMPYSPSPLLDELSPKKNIEILKLYEIEYGYFFYPAQIWAHKNHYRIIQATKLLHEEGIKSRVVFAGNDRGNQGYLKKIIKDLKLGNYFKFLGFVPNEHMSVLYKNCQAVIMPSYFGPTNLPPLESWFFKKPLIYSEHLYKQVKNAAILINPNEELSIANAMKLILDKTISKKYIKKGIERLDEIKSIKKIAEERLISKIIQFEKKRQCWN